MRQQMMGEKPKDVGRWFRLNRSKRESHKVKQLGQASLYELELGAWGAGPPRPLPRRAGAGLNAASIGRDCGFAQLCTTLAFLKSFNQGLGVGALPAALRHIDRKHAILVID
jgi:hypothetical protein